MPRTNSSKEVTASIKSAYGQKIKVFDAQIPFAISVVDASAAGKSIFAYDKRSKVAAAYEQFSKPANKKSSPQMGLTEENIAGSR